MRARLVVQTPPFDRLDRRHQRLLRSDLTPVLYSAGEVLQEAGEPAEAVFIVVAGCIVVTPADDSPPSEHRGDSVVLGDVAAHSGPAPRVEASEPSFCLKLSADRLRGLMEANHRFARFFSDPDSERAASTLPAASDDDPASFMLARIERPMLRKPVIVEPRESIGDSYRQLRAHRADCLLVRADSGFGIVTGTDLLDAIALEGATLDDPIEMLGSYDLITARLGDFVFRALVSLTHHHIERLVVFNGDEVAGVLELTDVLSQFATQSHALGIRIERAETIDELAEAARGLTALTRALVARGATVAFIMDLLAALNGRTMARLFDMLVPESVRPGVCLVVMGSEARGEQILKTDQDNAVILANDLDWPQCHEVLGRFSEQLHEFGYPPCPGNIMVSNPQWVMTLDEWKRRFDGWITAADGDAMLNLTVTSDMHAVGGNPDLYEDLNTWVMGRFSGGFGFFSTFVQAVLQFNVPLTLFGGLRGDTVDVKKGGIFAIVHGVRTLALEHGITETNTYRRIDELVGMGKLDARLGRDLANAFSVFVRLRLKQQLKAPAADIDGGGNTLEVKALGRLERDELKEAFATVKQFKGVLTRHYHVHR